MSKPKLNPKEVHVIRREYREAKWSGWGWPGIVTELADDYGVSTSTINRVVFRRSPYTYLTGVKE